MKKLLIAYFVMLHLLLTMTLLHANFIERVTNKLLSKTDNRPRFGEHFQQMLKFHLRMDGNIPKNSILFFGDSHIQGLYVQKVTQPILSVNYGIGGDTTDGLLYRLPKYNSILNAKALIIGIGFNDIKKRSNKEIINNWSKIIATLPNSLPIVFCAIFPIDEELWKNWKGINKSRIEQLNMDLERLTQKSPRFFYVNINFKLKDSKGNLADRFHDGDGVHLNPIGNAIWIEKLQKTLIQI